jgi:predicted transposase YbfD/YdcC
MVSECLVEAGFTLGSQAVDAKSNEIMEVPALMRSLTLRGAMVTIDAVGSQRAA